MAGLGTSMRLSLGFLSFILLLAAAPASADNIFERMVMPGEVIQGHADIEGDCGKCHEAFDQSSQIKLCVDCHDKVGADIARGEGLHGKRPDIKGSECKHCHSEHRGRDFDAVGLDRDTFEHRFTDFPLRGAHSTARCQGCHAPAKKHRDAPGRCIDCHRDDDSHRGRLGEACGDCHEETGWTEARFDHDKTDFPLKGNHKKVACESCHAGERYEGTPKLCVDCHRIQDVHGERFGRKCETCHTPEDWKTMLFDHNRDTDFDLLGKHAKATCESCHKGKLYEEELGGKCVDCHRTDDVHKGRNGDKCQDCHDPKGWATLGFDHNKDTKFPLTGRHAKLVCEDCHRGQVFEDKLETACLACHKLDDVHAGTVGQDCAACHAATGWKQLRFDHGRDTDFTLKERHAELQCQSCHRGPDPKREKLAMDCHACHKQDDVHKGQQGKACESCHNERSWAERVFFDHDLTRFPLIGLHTTATCEDCHTSQAFKDTASDCLACHAGDDVHKKRLGPKCLLCHNPNGWAFWRFDHDRQTDYPLDGAHLGLDCHACHTKEVSGEIEMATTCIACHRQDDVHRGGFGRNCERCHVTESFKKLKQTF